MKNGVMGLVSEEYVVLDGAMGTLLQKKGLKKDNLPEEWNSLHPEVVREIHLEYLLAGAQIVETNTFGASGVKMGMVGKDSIFKDVNKRGVELAIEALKAFRSTNSISGEEKRDKRYIAGSVGPTGKMLGINISQKEVEKSFADQGLILAATGVDLFIVETMMDLNEAELACKTLKRETRLPVFVSLVFNKTNKGDYRTLYGNSVSDTVVKLIDAGADAIGTNCGLIEEYIDVIDEMRTLTHYPLVIYPNAGIPKLKNGVTFFEQTPEYMISFLDRLIEAGATIIGGCCGTTPACIKLLSERLKGRKRKRLEAVK